MIKRNGKRFLSVLLAVCLMLSSLGAYPVYAVTREECTCGTVNERHADGCPLAEQKQETCTCTPVDGVHQEGCALYVAPADEEEPTSEPEAGCTCTPVDGVHQAGCNLYVAPLSNETEVQMTAGIYLDADRTNLAQLLTAEGATLEGWPFIQNTLSAEDRYLGISMDNLDMNKQYQLVVEMAPSLYLNLTSDPDAPVGASVSFTRNSPLAANGDGSYQLHKYSLANLTYLFDKGAKGMSIGLPLRFDVTLWNKKNGGSLGDGTDPLLCISLQEVKADGTLTTVHSQKLANATVSGSFPFTSDIGYYLLGGSSPSNTIDPDDSIRILFSHYGSTINVPHYAKTVTVEVQIPRCTVGGTEYFLPYEDFRLLTSSGTLPITLTEEMYDPATGTLTVEAGPLCFNNGNTFSIVFSAPSDFQEDVGLYTFNGQIAVTVDGEKLNRSIAIKLDTRNDADIKAVATASGKANIKEKDVVQPLGGLALKNAGMGHSAPLLIELKFDTKTVSVTTVNLMCDRASETITIWYTLVDRDGNPAFPDENGVNQVFTTVIGNPRYNYGNNITTLNENDYKTFTRADLPVAEHRDYFFETLSYTMGMLPANSSAYHTGAGLAPYSAGTIWGYVNVSEIPDSMPRHTLTVYQMPAGDEDEPKELANAYVPTNIDAGTSVSYGLENAKVSANTIVAGDSFTISGRVSTIRYPYSSNSCLNNIRLAVILPAGATLNESSISATYANGTKLAVQSVIKQAIEGTTDVLNIIVFQEGQKLGYYSERLLGLDNGTTLDFSVQVNTDKTMSAQPFTLIDHVFVAGDQLKNAAGGTFSVNAAKDTYDINGNGSTTDNIGCFSVKSTTASVSIQATPAELTITDELVNADGEAGASLPMKSFADILNYNLHVECTEGGRASDFYYIIPIPKTTMTADPVFVSKCQVDLVLKGEATFSHSQGTAMKLLYSTTPITGYSDALNLTDWSETLPEGKTWVDVTAIKIICAEEQIENGSISVISLPLGYNGEDTEYEHMAGYQIQWSSRGYYYYNVGFNNNAGTKSTDGTTITLNYTRQEPVRFTLTAAKDGKPTAPGASNTYVLDLEVLFYLAQEYRVKQITPYNVNLMGADYDFDTATSAEANENFRINIAVKNQGEESFQAPMALQKDNDIIGSLGENSRPVFSFTIENADALSDIVTERKVTLTLIGSNGVIVPVEITIKRELAAAEPTTSAIVAGKLYAPFEGGTEIQVSRDSAFTAQFVTQYIPANYTGHSLVFSQAPVSGTTITMIDWTYPSTLKFYQYTMGGNTTTVKLTAFQGMGGSGAFTESSETNVVTERLLFIVSFPAGGEPTRDNTIKLIKNLTTDTKIEESSVLKFTTVGKRGFSISASADSVDNGKDFTISYTSGCDVTDSRYANRNLSLVVKPAQGEFPNNARLVVNGTSYYLNAQGCFLVPLRAVHAGSGTVTVCYEAQSGEDISLQISLWASSTANGAKPLMGGQVADPVTVSAKANVDPSFAVTSMSNRLLELEDLANTITVVFRKKNATTVTVELQKKVGNGYVTQTTVLESVNGKTTADVAQGVFSVNGTSVVIKLSSLTEIGTYRLLFKVSSGSKTIEVPYNFVVVQ